VTGQSGGATSTVTDLERLFAGETEYAVFDVREAGEAEQGHIAGATFLPRRLIEFRIAELVADPATTIVLYDNGDDDRRAEMAARTLADLGYRAVSVLAGGAEAWAAAGHRLIEGSNVPSKLFGETLLSSEHVPEMTAEELATWRQSERPFLIADIRTPEEHALAHVPGARPAPSFDVARNLGDFEDAGVPIVVHCAGRTRSIIAAQTLRDLGLSNVFAMKNGTMGWTLAGHDLDRSGPAPAFEPSNDSVARFEQRAASLAERFGVTGVTMADLTALLDERDSGTRNGHVFDVRPLKDYLDGHIEGAVALPGGQAVQRADEFVAVKAAPIIFVDDKEGRAIVTASWFRRMGYPNAFYLDGGLDAWMAAGYPLAKGRGRQTPLGLGQARHLCRFLTSEEAREALERHPDTLVLNVDHSRNYVAAHIEGSVWLPRGSLEQSIGEFAGDPQTPILVTCRNGSQSAFANATLVRMGYVNSRVLDGGIAAWQKAGLPTASGGVDETTANDLVLPPYARGKAGMRRYLEWEEKLTAEKDKHG